MLIAPNFYWRNWVMAWMLRIWKQLLEDGGFDLHTPHMNAAKWASLAKLCSSILIQKDTCPLLPQLRAILVLGWSSQGWWLEVKTEAWGLLLWESTMAEWWVKVLHAGARNENRLRLMIHRTNSWNEGCYHVARVPKWSIIPLLCSTMYICLDQACLDLSNPPPMTVRTFFL